MMCEDSDNSFFSNIQNNIESTSIDSILGDLEGTINSNGNNNPFNAFFNDDDTRRDFCGTVTFPCK